MEGKKLTKRIVDRQVSMEVSIIFVFNVFDGAQVPNGGESQPVLRLDGRKLGLKTSDLLSSVGLAVRVLDPVCKLPNCPCFRRFTRNHEFSRLRRTCCRGMMAVLGGEVYILR